MNQHDRRISEEEKRDLLRANFGRIERECRSTLKHAGGKFSCPGHPDKTPSLSVFPDHHDPRIERFKCHSCGKGSDLFDWLEWRHGLPFMEAWRELKGQSPADRPPPKPAGPPRPALHEVLPDGVNTPRPGAQFRYISARTGEDKWITPDLVHVYRNVEGKPIGVTIRIVRPAKEEGGKPEKRILPFRYGLDGKWHGLGWTKAEGPVPIYNRDLLERNSHHFVVVVEGEKKADLINGLVGNEYVGICCPNGINNLGNADWSCLEDRVVILWPDNDDAGRGGMGRLGHDILPAFKPALVYQVFIPDGTPKKWDVVDFVESLPKDQPAGVRLSEFLDKNSQHAIWSPEEAERVAAQDKEIAEYRKQKKQKRVQPLPEWGRELGWVRNAEGNVAKRAGANAFLQLTHDPDFKDRIRYDTFDRQVLIDGRELEPADIYRLCSELNQVAPHLSIEPTPMMSLVAAIAAQKPFQVNRFADELRALKWDGTYRVMAELPRDGAPGLLARYCGVERSPFTDAAGLRWMVSLVRRVCEPGVQVDSMLVLEGKQGSLKTSFFAELGKICGRDVYGRLTSHALAADKDNLLKMAGKAIIEMVEMTSQRKADEGALKAFLDTREDSYRPPYGRRVENFPRHNVFGGTTNELGSYLNDTTGNRRFWPARVERPIEIEQLRQDVEQLWAEAMHWAYLAEPTEQHWLTPDEVELQIAAVEVREIGDPWAAILEKEIYGRARVPNDELYGHVGVEKKDRTPRLGKRLADIMIKLGFKLRRDSTGDRPYAWYNS